MTRRLREGRWLCPSCGRENRGRFESCEEGCGKPRPHDVRFYLPENSPLITDPALRDEANAGVNWTCSHCGGANPANHEGHVVIACAHCGNGRDGGDTDYHARSFGLGQVPRTAEQANPKRPSRRKEAQAPKPRSRRRIPAFAVIGLILLLSLGTALSIFVPTENITGEISSKTWARSIGVETIVTETESDWSIPSGGRVISTETRVRSHKDVIIGYTTDTRTEYRSVVVGTEQYQCGSRDLGNGFFEDVMCSRNITRSEPYEVSFERPITERVPVKDTWHTYQIDRWREIRRVDASGTGRKDPSWPALKLKNGEREGARQQSYSANITIETGETSRKSLSEEDYHIIARGDEVGIFKNIWGAIVSTTFPSAGKIQGR